MSFLKNLLVATAGASFVTLGATATVQAVTLTSTGDSYIANNDRNANFGSLNPLLVKSANGSTDDRKAYVRFDLSSITSPSLTSAIFSLTGVAGGGTLNSTATSNFNVYGLTNAAPAPTPANQTWIEDSITWNNAPGNDGSDNGVIAGNPLVGSFQVIGNGAGTPYSINSTSNSNLLIFLNARLNDPDNNLATFIVTRLTSSGTGIGTGSHAFISEEVSSGNPTLNVTEQATAVPFEFSPGLGILALGAWGAVAQLKSKLKNRKPLTV